MAHNPNFPEEKSLKDRVLARIEANKVTVYPKALFTLRMLALGVVAALVLLVSIFICNFIFFILRLNSRLPLLAFGPRGFFFFMQLFPWTWLVVDVSLVLLLEWLLRKFRFGYRRPVLYTFLAVLAITVAAALFLDRATRFNDELLWRAERQQLPSPVSGFYRGARHPLPPGSGLCRCMITAIHGNVLTAENTEASSSPLTIVLPSQSPELEVLKTGDIVLVAGDVTSGTIRAFGIRGMVFNPERRP